MAWPVMVYSKASMGPSCGSGAQVVGPALQLMFDGQSLQGVGNLVGEVAADGQLALEKGHACAQLFQQFLIGEPDEVLEADRDELVAVGDLQVEFDSLRRKLESVSNVAESAGFAQMLAHES